MRHELLGGEHSLLAGKLGYLSSHSKGSRPGSAWLKRRRTRRRESRPLLPTQGASNFPHLSPAESLIPRAPSQSCFNWEFLLSYGQILGPFPLDLKSGLSGPKARAPRRGQHTFKLPPWLGGQYLSPRGQPGLGSSPSLAGLRCVWLMVGLRALEVNKGAATADRVLVCERGE